MSGRITDACNVAAGAWRVCELQHARRHFCHARAIAVPSAMNWFARYSLLLCRTVLRSHRGDKGVTWLTFTNRASYIQDGRTATLQMLHFIYFFSTNRSTEYFKHAAHSPFLSSKCCLFRNATFFGSCVIHILHTGCGKI
jgi:hypothetical protein